MHEIETGYAEVDGAKIYYEVSGEGHPLILVHAGVGDCRMWDDQFSAFAEHYRVVRYDARGYGKTGMVPGDYWPHEDLHGMMTFLGITKAHLLGCSMGGEACVDFTLAHPEKVSSLIAVCSALSGYDVRQGLDAQGKLMAEAYGRGDFEACAEVVAQIWVDGPRRRPGQVNTALRDKVKEMALISLKTPDGLGEEQPATSPAIDRLDEITAPTLVIYGDIDQPGIVNVAVLLAEGIKGAQKVVIPGTAHVPNMEKPDKFNKVVLDFLAGL